MSLRMRFLEYLKVRWEAGKVRCLNRAALRDLSKLNESQLRDIGVSQGDVRWAKTQSDSQAAMQALELVARGHHKDHR